MKSDLLSEWLQEMKLFKWSTATNDPIFTKENLEKIAHNIREFFPSLLYDPLRKNWLVNFLTKKDPMLICFGDQLSAIIDYYYKVHGETGYTIDPSCKSMNQVRDDFFELYVNLILNKNGIDAQVNDKYFISDDMGIQIEKPLDSSFIFNDDKYLIECKKLYNRNATNLLDATTSVIQNILNDDTGEKRITHGDTLPTGYIFIKGRSDSIIKHIKNDFHNCYSRYTEGMKFDTDIITPFVEVKTEEYEIRIEPTIFGNFKSFEKLAEKQSLAILFTSVILNYHEGRVKLAMQAIHKFTESEITSRLRKVIETKIDQHKKALLNKIIFVDFEQEISSFGSLTLYFNIHDINSDRIVSLTKKDVSIFLLSRRYGQGKMYVQSKLFKSDNLNKELANKLEKLNYSLQ